MNIQIITSSYPSFPEDPSGTAGLFVRAFALELLSRGHRVVVQPVARKERYIPDDGLIIEPLAWQGGDRELASLNFFSPGNWWVIGDFFRRARSTVFQVHGRYEIDRTLCMWAVPAGLLGYWIKRRLNKPYDVWVLGSDLWRLRRVPVLGGMVLGRILGKADRVFADGIGLCREVESVSRRPCEFLPSSRALPSWSHVRKDRGEHGEVDLLYVGRYHHNKGPDLLLEAFRMVSVQHRSRIRLRMFGVGDMKGALLAYIEEHHLGDCVAINDGICADDLVKELVRSDYLIIPSRIESIPVVFSDAMQTGTPVIATPVGDLKGLIEEHGCGIVADGISAEALAHAIEAGCMRRGKNGFSENALKLSRQFRTSDAVDRWLGVS